MSVAVANAYDSFANLSPRFLTVTLSTAKGITDFAPESKKQKEILKAIATDVDYVIRYVAEARQRKINNAENPTRVGQNSKDKNAEVQVDNGT